MINLSKETRIAMLEHRIQRLSSSEKNFKCPGVLRKCRRDLRHLKKES